jgi:hypothetical protein
MLKIEKQKGDNTSQNSSSDQAVGGLKEEDLPAHPKQAFS